MPYIFIKYLEYKTGLVVPTILSYSTMGWWKVSPMMVDMGLFHAFGVANMLEMNPSDVRLLVFPLLSSSQHWQRLTPMFWPWPKLRPFRSFQYSMWCSATPRYFFYSMFNIFRKFRDFPLVWHFFFDDTGNDHNFMGRSRYFHCCLLYIPVNHIPIDWKKETIYASSN